MHPLVARIHPSVRTALFAWLFSRSVLWLTHPGRTAEFANGSPLPGLVHTWVHHIHDSVSSQIATQLIAIAPWVVLEVLMVIAGIGVYRFARTTDLDRVAERACWIWFFNPVLALYALDWGTQVGIAAGTIAFGAIVTRHPKAAAAATVVAVASRPEFVLLAPALAAAAWAYRHQGDQSPTETITCMLAAPAAFTATIAASWHLAGNAHTSLRSLHDGVAWRTGGDWLPAVGAESIAAIALVGAALLAVRYVRRFPWWYAAVGLPAVIWPLMHAPMHAAAATAAWSIPGCVHLAVAGDDPSVARATIAALAVGFTLIAAGL